MKLQSRMDVIRDDIIRVRISGRNITNSRSLIIEDGIINACTGNGTADGSLSTKKLTVVLSGDACAVEWYDEKSGKLLLRQPYHELSEVQLYSYSTNGEKPVIDRVKTVDGERNFIRNLEKHEDRKAYRAKAGFEFAPDEGIYGFGQGEEGVYDLRHHEKFLYQHNMRIPMPMFISDAGYGMLFNCGSLMTFEDREEGTYLFMDAVDQLDFFFVLGPSADEIIDGFRYLTGRAAMLPKWAYGYVQSKEAYHTDAELLDVVKHYRKLGVPLDCIVQDWNTWESGKWGNKHLDQERYGNIKECMDGIHAMHVHSMVSVWPNMASGCADYEELMEKGLMLNDLSTYDAFNEEARKVYWQQAKEGLFDRGFDSWWCDSTEPFSGPDWGGDVKREPWERYELVGNEHKKYLDAAKANEFALVHAKGIYDNQKSTTKEKRVLNLTRSGFAGGQKYAAMLWSGDTCASWETLRRQIVEGLNMGLSGYPYWTLDIGGFFTVGKKWKNRGCGCNQDPTPKWFWNGIYDEGVKDAGYRELYVRWFEFGTFLPMFRSHGTDTPREIWNFGRKGDICYDSIEKFIRLRYTLMPYIYSLAGAVRLENATIMRSLLFDFMKDRKARAVKDEFMFGKEMLICPVTSPAETRECYLPKGCGWVDYWTGEYLEGGQTVTRQTPLDSIPVFLRSGAVVPMAEGLQYADDTEGRPLIIYLAGHANGSFTYYEDAGDGFDYEAGGYATVDIKWNEKKGVLTISGRKGKYAGMKDSIEVIIRQRAHEDVHVTYGGKRLEVRM